MRTLLTATAATLTLLLAAGCSASTEPAKGTTTKTSAAATTSATADTSAQAAAIRQELLTDFGVTEFSQILAQDPQKWAGYISDITVDHGKVNVALQVDQKQGKGMAKDAAKALSTLLSRQNTEGLSWVVVTDGAGVVMAQEQLNPVA